MISFVLADVNWRDDCEDTEHILYVLMKLGTVSSFNWWHKFPYIFHGDEAPHALSNEVIKSCLSSYNYY